MVSLSSTPSRSDQRTLKLLLKDCAKGFYQQMYFLGKDVTHAKGNQLIKYGFTKSASRGLKGSSCYTLDTHSSVIELYGSCAAYYSDQYNVAFLRPKTRFYHWRPDERCIAGLWKPHDIESGSPESLYEAITPLLTWWVEYEEWIKSSFGEHYRERCYKEWQAIKTHQPWLPPSEATSWVNEFLTHGSSHVRPKNIIRTARQFN